jgi:hypothetical protein
LNEQDANYVNYNQIRGYTIQFCWAAELTGAGNGSCSDLTVGNVNWLGANNQVDPRKTIDNLPKWIALIGLLFLIPHYYWDNIAGGTLKGYILHLQFLIQIIKNKCETVPTVGKYGGDKTEVRSVFDKKSETFSNSKKYKKYWVENFMNFKKGPNIPSENKEEQDEDVNSRTNLIGNGDQPNQDIADETQPPPVASESESDEFGGMSDEQYNNAAGDASQVQIEMGSRISEVKIVNRVQEQSTTTDESSNIQGFRDRHLFSLLCHRNFAHLPEMTFIESVQRVATHGAHHVAKHSYTDPKTGLKVTKYMTPLEKRVIEGQDFENGILWCVTKLFTGDQNFTGKQLLRKYSIRLTLTLALDVAGFVIMASQELYLIFIHYNIII